MGLKRKFTSLINSVIPLEKITLEVNFDEYNNMNKNIISKNETNGTLTLIVDGNAFFYEVGEKLNYFPFDYKLFIREIQEELNLFLCIKDLKKIIFVFDGVDDPSKKNIKEKREKDRYHSVKNLNNRIFYKNIMGNKSGDEHGKKNCKEHESIIKNIIDNKSLGEMEAQKNKNENNNDFIKDIKEKKNNSNKKHPYFGYTLKYCPSPIELTTYIQYIIYRSKENNKLEVRFETKEADNSIARLAKKENGYVISSDSDFYIYDIPGFIDYKSININQGITFELYTIDLLENYLGFSRDLFPLFATLIGNDFIYPKYRSIVKLIKDFNINNDSIDNSKYEFIENLKLYIQAHAKINKDTLIDEILKYVSENEEEEIYKEFKDCMIKSLNHYNIENNNENEPIRIGKNILKSYYNGNIHSKLLNVIQNKSYMCNQYFEVINEGNCWDITDKLRIKMYKYLIMRNENDLFGKNDKKFRNYSIVEYKRKKGRQFKLQ